MLPPQRYQESCRCRHRLPCHIFLPTDHRASILCNHTCRHTQFAIFVGYEAPSYPLSSLRTVFSSELGRVPSLDVGWQFLERFPQKDRSVQRCQCASPYRCACRTFACRDWNRIVGVCNDYLTPLSSGTSHSARQRAER
jgi:hypothetical protein